jgi:hypothetical protein
MSDRVREAIEIAREHLEWCSHKRVLAGELMALLGMKDPGPRRPLGRSVRAAILASIWMQLPMTTAHPVTVKSNRNPRKTGISRTSHRQTGVVSRTFRDRLAA